MFKRYSDLVLLAQRRARLLVETLEVVTVDLCSKLCKSHG